jgi:hypothetical protein
MSTVSGFAGEALSGSLPLVGYAGGFRLPGAIIASPASTIVAYVRSTGVQSGDPPDVADRMTSSLANALTRVRPGMGDIIAVLPGHFEAVSDALMLANLRTYTRIVGIGSPRLATGPTFRWEATGARWDVNQAGVSLENLRLLCDGANGVVNAINVTADGFNMSGCFVRWAQSATLKATIGMTLGTGATNATIAGNEIDGTPAHNVTNGILVSGVATGLRIIRNRIMASATAANGLINVTGAALRMYIAENDLANQMTSSTSCITLGAAASSGLICRNMCSVENTASVAADVGILVGGTSIVRLFGNETSDTVRTRGVPTGAAST